MTWRESRVTRVEILSKEGQTCRIRTGIKATVRSAGKSIPTWEFPDGAVDFPTTKGTRYVISR